MCLPMGMRTVVRVAMVVVVLACGGSLEDTSGDGGSFWSVPLTTQTQLDKVDLLFAIDNSASMGDKQDLLALAVPVLVGRLLNPNCVDTDVTHDLHAGERLHERSARARTATSTGNGGAGQCFVPGDNGGGDNQCTSIANTKAEFPPVHDMHIGIVSSSLGSAAHVEHRPVRRLGQRRDAPGRQGPPPQSHVRRTTPTVRRSTTRSRPTATAETSSRGSPRAIRRTQARRRRTSRRTATVRQTQLSSRLQSRSCKASSSTAAVSRRSSRAGTASSSSRIRTTRIQLDQRQPAARHARRRRRDAPQDASRLPPARLARRDHPAHRRRGLVERSAAGSAATAGRRVRSAFPGGPGSGVGPRGTSECDQPDDSNNPTTRGPNNPGLHVVCVSGSNKPVSGTQIGDPNCNVVRGRATRRASQTVGTRRRRARCPSRQPTASTFATATSTCARATASTTSTTIQRYVDGLRSPTVPDRDNEAHQPNPYCDDRSATARTRSSRRISRTAPTRAPARSATSRRARARRTSSSTRSSAASRTRSSKTRTATSSSTSRRPTGRRSSARIPTHYVFDGIDPHMIESTAPRPGLPTPGTTLQPRHRSRATVASGTRSRRPRRSTSSTRAPSTLPTPKDCNAAANAGACDCTGAATTTADGPPLCDDGEPHVADQRQGVPDDPRAPRREGSRRASRRRFALREGRDRAATPRRRFGYNPAMQAIVNRLKTALSGQCLPRDAHADRERRRNGPVLDPRRLPDPDGSSRGLHRPRHVAADAGSSHRGASRSSISCRKARRARAKSRPSCASSSSSTPASTTPARPATARRTIGWCYVEGAANTGGCSQAIKFGGRGPPSGATLDLECVGP